MPPTPKIKKNAIENNIVSLVIVRIHSIPHIAKIIPKINVSMRLTF